MLRDEQLFKLTFTPMVNLAWAVCRKKPEQTLRKPCRTKLNTLGSNLKHFTMLMRSVGCLAAKVLNTYCVIMWHHHYTKQYNDYCTILYIVVYIFAAKRTLLASACAFSSLTGELETQFRNNYQHHHDTFVNGVCLTWYKWYMSGNRPWNINATI